MSARAPRFGIVVSRFNREITDLLPAGASACFRTHRVPARSIDVQRVPGAFELKYLSEATYLGLSLAGVMSGVPVTSGVITAKSWRHARERAKPEGLNRGGEAAQAAWEMSQQLKNLKKRRTRS